MLAFGFLSFLAFGLALVVVGANQAHLERELGLSLAETGLLASSLSAGLGVGVVGAGPLFDRYPRRPLFVGSMLLVAAALGTAEEGSGLRRWLVQLFAAGAGIGVYDTLLNAAVVQRFREASARPMAVLHAAATLGAVAGPPLAGLLAGRGYWIGSFHLVGAAHLVLAGAALLVPLPAPEKPGPSDDTDAGPGWSRLLPFAVIAFAYVGIEAALTVFAVPYAGQLGLAPERGRMGISALWLGLLAGRLGVLTLRRTLDAHVLAAAGVGGALVLLAGTLTPLSQPEATLFLAGASLGCVYPVMIALAGQRFPRARGTAAGLAAGAGAIGGFGVPWLTGALGDTAGVEIALASLAGWSALVAAAALAARGSG